MKLLWSLLIATLIFSHSGECRNKRRAKNDDLATGNELTSTNYDEGDFSSDETLLKGRDVGWDPSFLDILSSDYFDESPKPKKASNKNNFVQEDEDSTLPSSIGEDDNIGVPVAPSVEEEIVTGRPVCSGCARDIDPEDAKIQEIANFAFKSHLDSLEDEDAGRHLVRVVKAQTQVVAGQKYMIDVEMGYSNCSKAELKLSEQTCLIDPEKETFICNFEILEQKWRNHTELLLTRCDQAVSDADLPAELEPDPEEAEGRMGELDENSDEMEDATTTSTATLGYDAPQSRRKRETKTPIGSLRDADEDKDTLMELARFAVEQLDVIDEDNDARLVMDILSAKKQTVSGWLYHLKIRVAQTTCEEGTKVSYENCKEKIVLPYNVCSVKILFQPWQTVQKKVTESQCSPEKMKKGKKLGKQYFKKDENSQNEVMGKTMLGGFSPVDPDSQDLLELADFVTSSVDLMSNALHAQKLVRVIEAHRQVVSGIKTKMVIEMGYTSCRKSQTLDKSKCDIDESREHNFCNITVWEQPWMKTRKITDSKCGRKEDLYKDSRRKRSLITARNLGSNIDGVVISTGSSIGDLDEKKFSTFMAQHSKKYQSEEEYKYRLGVFRQNLQKIKLLQEYEQGTATYGVTKFADLTEEEFSKHYVGLRPDLRQRHKPAKKADIPPIAKLPEEFDWRHYNAVTPVKNQGLCGSCWAFSVTGNIEGLYALKHKNLVSFSEQELVDCDTLDEGCNGGLPENAYKILQKIGGLETESEYPYDGKNEKCSFDVSKAQAKVKGFVELPKNETEIAMYLMKHGPISIGINANAMQFYWGGVSHPWKFLCSPKSLDHGVLIVGYGVHTYPRFNRTLPFWTVKNSWGESWGEQGYYRVYRGANTCGIAEMATSAKLF